MTFHYDRRSRIANSRRIDFLRLVSLVKIAMENFGSFTLNGFQMLFCFQYFIV